MSYNVQGAKPVYLVDDTGNTYSANAVNTGAAFTATLAATTNATSVKASAGNLYELDVSNLTAATVYVKLYNKASAPTVGTDVPVITLPVTAGAFIAQQFGQYGKRFTTGIAYAVTGAATDADATAISAGAKIGLTYI